ncbi:hypothetical protein [Brevundimonas sp.]|uniref:hypothetical protein n=1 Tax=Brevundimonas sp. TaxID=1871086 RepID=UPI002489B95C|nr:hypothetical protein [Brevundimonas sp.]MDI1279905.1 hypothetical protein [Brevundimonas sp.]
MTLAMSFSEPYVRFRRSAPVFDRALRWGQMAAGVGLFLAGIAIAPLPGPLGVPVSMLGLAMVLKNSYWAKRQFIRVQRKRPKFVYPFRRLLRKNPEFAPVFWQQALRAEKLVLKRTNRVLSRLRKSARRQIRKMSR